MACPSRRSLWASRDSAGLETASGAYLECMAVKNVCSASCGRLGRTKDAAVRERDRPVGAVSARGLDHGSI